MSNRPAAYAIRLMNDFERAVRQHAADTQYGQCSKAEQLRYEKAKERLARKIGQLATDAERMAPDGWKLVPIQPTEEIQDAVNRAIHTVNSTNTDVWRAGVDAA